MLSNRFNDAKTKMDEFLDTKEAAKKTWDDYKKKEDATDAQKLIYEKAFTAAEKEYNSAKEAYDTIGP